MQALLGIGLFRLSEPDRGVYGRAVFVAGVVIVFPIDKTELLLPHLAQRPKFQSRIDDRLFHYFFLVSRNLRQWMAISSGCSCSRRASEISCGLPSMPQKQPKARQRAVTTPGMPHADNLKS